MLTRLSVIALVAASLACFPALANPPVVKLAVMRDGTFEIDGKRYRDDAALKAKIKELAAEEPQPSFVVVAEKPSAMNEVQMVGQAILILQKAGIARVGFLVEPHRN